MPNRTDPPIDYYDPPYDPEAVLVDVAHALQNSANRQQEIVSKLDEIFNALVQANTNLAQNRSALADIDHSIIRPPRRSDHEGVTSWLVRVVRVVTVNGVVRGPDIYLPPGYSVIIRQRHHAGSPVGYIGPASASVLNTNERVEMADGDTVILRGITNMKDVYFNADTVDTYFEIIAEL